MQPVVGLLCLLLFEPVSLMTSPEPGNAEKPQKGGRSREKNLDSDATVTRYFRAQGFPSHNKLRACDKSSIGGEWSLFAPRARPSPPRTENKGQPAKREQSASRGIGRANLVCLEQGKLRGTGQAQNGGEGNRIHWCYTKYAIEEGAIAEFQSRDRLTVDTGVEAKIEVHFAITRYLWVFT